MKHTIAWNMTRLTEGNEYWTPEVLAQSLLGIWFAASHQPYMNLNFVLLELCVRQDWVTALREELSDADPLDYQRLEALPLLDSFVKETVRLNPLDTRKSTLTEICSLDAKTFLKSPSDVRL